MTIKTVQEALTLPQGRLIGYGIVVVSFSAETVEAAAKLIIARQVTEKFFSQASVIAYAGNHLGWGVARPYRAD